ncbi:spore coat protein [Cohnella caldifontis]|uniref:spore coat protein n=1 Tax=Cohnella caldifontis TaxID=3027471 RepID=UPI0023EB9A76|nr:spore coat protein [Cohnella sp. YIM B05605]
MIPVIEKLMGLDVLTDQVIGWDLLTSSKSGIHMLAVAATEAATPELKAAIRKQLFEAIDTHEQLTRWMADKGFYRPYDVPEQIRQDRANLQTALNLPS